ncbi:hypothetical protein Y032_0656g1226 [Ancylostoma ceylanicum]|uniref:Uncharacterized protein n=1 Tax=Ancylostoma ceylanicum TaxID=53326 RepID=A0A016WIK1_9BILA|nr:hypothetical protein Y032_0656g1226 [Ancylostoma ceylanicum]
MERADRGILVVITIQTSAIATQPPRNPDHENTKIWLTTAHSTVRQMIERGRPSIGARSARERSAASP